jgi:hypothetical protein
LKVVTTKLNDRTYIEQYNDYFEQYNIPDTGTYSFALQPEQHQPSGTCNLSRIENARFRILSPY